MKKSHVASRKKSHEITHTCPAWVSHKRFHLFFCNESKSHMKAACVRVQLFVERTNFTSCVFSFFLFDWIDGYFSILLLFASKHIFLKYNLHISLFASNGWFQLKKVNVFIFFFLNTNKNRG